jgi:hypothetical protein
MTTGIAGRKRLKQICRAALALAQSAIPVLDQPFEYPYHPSQFLFAFAEVAQLGHGHPAHLFARKAAGSPDPQNP